MWRVTKRYGHEQGLSCCFRQWRAESHCAQLHGYALAFELVFEAKTLDDRNWVIDFGSMKPIKAWLQETFDHTLVVAEDDPQVYALKLLADSKLANIKIMRAVGCEMFAKEVYDWVNRWLQDGNGATRVKLLEVTCSEHAGNSATYIRGL